MSTCLHARAFAHLLRPTSVRAVERGKGHDEEGGGVLPGVHQVREGALGVAVAPEALDEAHPGGETLDDGPHAVRVAVAHEVIWEGGRGGET